MGSKVKKVKVGHKVGVGVMVDSCKTCENCINDLENYCPKLILTYGSINTDGKITYGGYSDHMIANERYIVKFPDNMPLDAAAPLLCAGITVYSPLKYFGLAEEGKHVGIVGLGGLGHVAVKFAKAFGAKVTVISTSPSKKTEALEHLGADFFLNSREPDQMQVIINYISFIVHILENENQTKSHSLIFYEFWNFPACRGHNGWYYWHSLCCPPHLAINRSAENSWKACYGWCPRQATRAIRISLNYR